MRWLSILLAGTLLFAGCIGDTTDDADPQAADGPDATNVSDYVWSNETFEGLVTGASVPMVGTANAPTSQSTLAEFTVPNGTQTLALELTTDGGQASPAGGELQMNIGGPDCEASAQATCETSVATDGGNATWENATPEPGQWHARIFPSSPAVVEASFTLEVLTLAPGES